MTTYTLGTLPPFGDPRVTFTEWWPDGDPENGNEGLKTPRIDGASATEIDFDPTEGPPTDADMYKAYLLQLTQEAEETEIVSDVGAAADRGDDD